MEIQIKGGNYYGIDIHYKAENVNVIEDVFETIYGKDENGKTDYSKRLGRDVADEVLNKFCSITEDLIYYREKKYNSLSLINQLLNKLPEKEKLEIYNSLKDEFDENI